MRLLKDKVVQSSVEGVEKPEVPAEVRRKWQRIVNLMAEIIGVPAGLIMKLEPPYIRVFVSSATDGNPYRVGDKEFLMGLYCETVIKTSDMLLVPHALKDEKWKYNPDVKLGMISYLGLPIVWPDGEPFGTICVLDNEENEYSELYIDLLREFRDVVETDLQLLCQTQRLMETADHLEALKREIKESQQKFERLFIDNPEATCYMDPDFRVVTINPRFEELFGYSLDEIEGRHINDVIVPKDKLEEAEMLGKKAGKGYVYHDTLRKRKDGSLVPVSISAAPITIEGQLIGYVGLYKDITERKKAEEKIWESETKYRVLYETIRDGIAATDMDGRIVECNQAFADMLGYSKDEVKNLTYQKLTPKKWHQMEAKIVKEQIVKRGYSDEYEKEYIRKDGTVFPISIRVWLIRGEDGKPAGMWGIVRDITERKKIEQEIAAQRAFRESVLNSMIDGIATVDLEGVQTYVSPSFCRMVGYEKSELEGRKPPFPYWSPEEIEDVMQKFELQALREKDLVQSVETVFRRKNGELFPVSITVSKLRDDQGKVVGSLACVKDLTEKKMMEDKLKEYAERLEEKVRERTKELRESEERYSSMIHDAIDSLESGIFILDKDFKVVWINKAVEKFFGVKKEDLIGKDKRRAIKEKIKYAFEDPERFEKTLLATYENNTYVENFECHVLPSEEREERFLEHWSTPIKTGAYAGGRIEHYYDITKLKRLEEQLLRSERLAAIGELATMVGHDLRNPLQSIENAIYYLTKELPRLSPSVPVPQKAREMLQVIIDSVDYADRIIKDLHDFSATKRPVLKKIDVNAIVKAALSQVEAPENVELVSELGQLPRIDADEDMIKRVFLNLAVNGIQAMEKGGRLKVSTKKTKGFVEVSFKDTGVGIPKETMKKLFTPFFTTKSKGMGVGLAICKKFVEAHGGSIKVESEEGKGTTFTVKLPIQQKNGGENYR